MAFILAFGDDGPDLDVVVTPTRAFIEFPVGFDPDEGTAYTLGASLDDVPTGGSELSFWLVASYPSGAQETFWDGAATGFIDRLSRNVILQALLGAVTNLIRVKKPGRVAMITQRRDLPDKAIRKYRAVNVVFTAEGYAVKEQPLMYGVRYWTMWRQQI